MKTTVQVKLDVRDPDLSRIREIARGAREGKIVAFPTETCYGIGAPMSARNLEQTLNQIKKREPGKPYSHHIGSPEMLDLLKVESSPAFRYLTRLFWPGPVTIVTAAREGKIGLRYPRNRLATSLFNAVGEPFLATSANLSGMPSPRTAEEVASQLGGQIDYLIDGGRTELGQDSSVVDLTGPEPAMLRRGAQAKEVEQALEKIRSGKFPRKKVLFVCTGNSCRSPMAQGYLESELRRKGLAEEIQVSSCGIGARPGGTATPEAVLIMKNREIDISQHRTRACTREDILDAEIVFVMSPEHYTFIAGLVPTVKEKIKVLNVTDPIGMGIGVYEDAMQTIEKKLREYWGEIAA